MHPISFLLRTYYIIIVIDGNFQSRGDDLSIFNKTQIKVLVCTGVKEKTFADDATFLPFSFTKRSCWFSL